jgi:hypothetical protein
MRAFSPHEHASTPRRSPYSSVKSPLTAHLQEAWTSLRPSFYHETAAWLSDTASGASQPARRWVETESGDGLRGVGGGRCISGGDGSLAGGDVDGGPGGMHDSVAGLRVACGYGAGRRAVGSSHPSLHSSEGALAGAGLQVSPAVEDSDDLDSDGPAGREWAEYWAKEALPGSPSRAP